MLKNKTIGFLGCGNMAEAIIKGLITSKTVSPALITASDISKERLAYISETYAITVHNKNFEVVLSSDIIFLSIKPKDTESVLSDIARTLMENSPKGEKVIVSIIAGKKTSTINEILNGAGVSVPTPIIRTMPNTPATLGLGITGYFVPSDVSEENAADVRELLLAVGEAVRVTKEDDLDTVTGLSGSGPAYVYSFIRALTEGGVENGLSEEAAFLLATKTVEGAAALAKRSIDDGKTLEELIKMVSSPGGTTIEGLKKLKEGDFEDTVKKALSAATNRAKEL
ncbi:MAG: pyrroline-5-carboxylate reductase, partial [Deltaproteobacteria bacterium]|nr:pyrroline-5-carboxylate reductase [Deltaproteobacteria bacterium]